MTVQFSDIIKASLAMINTAGAISAPGLKVGDIVLGAWLSDTTWRQPASIVEAIVTVDDELQVLSSGQGTAQWTFLLFR